MYEMGIRAQTPQRVVRIIWAVCAELSILAGTESSVRVGYDSSSPVHPLPRPLSSHTPLLPLNFLLVVAWRTG